MAASATRILEPSDRNILEMCEAVCSKFSDASFIFTVFGYESGLDKRNLIYEQIKTEDRGLIERATCNLPGFQLSFWKNRVRDFGNPESPHIIWKYHPFYSSFSAEYHPNVNPPPSLEKIFLAVSTVNGLLREGALIPSPGQRTDDDGISCKNASTIPSPL